MRDHLLGCHQFQAVESSDDYEHYGCGVPRRVLDAQRPQLRGVSKEEDFERRDKTPVSMRADFPHEYDLPTMYGDAAKRGYKAVFGQPFKIHDEAVLVSREISDWVKSEIERRCGIPKVSVGVDFSRGDDMAAAIAYAAAPHAKAAAESRAEIVARILADKQRLRPGKRPLWRDL